MPYYTSNNKKVGNNVDQHNRCSNTSDCVSFLYVDSGFFTQRFSPEPPCTPNGFSCHQTRTQNKGLRHQYYTHDGIHHL